MACNNRKTTCFTVLAKQVEPYKYHVSHALNRSAYGSQAGSLGLLDILHMQRGNLTEHFGQRR